MFSGMLSVTWTLCLGHAIEGTVLLSLMSSAPCPVGCWRLSCAWQVTAELLGALREPWHARQPRGPGCNFTAANALSSALMASDVPPATQPPATDSPRRLADLWCAIPLPLQQLLDRPCRKGPPNLRRRRLLSAATGAPPAYDSATADAEDSWRYGSPAEWLPAELGWPNASQRQLTAADTKPRVPSVNTSWVGIPKLLHDPYAQQQLPIDSAALVQRYEAIGHACPLFARKFAPTVSRQLAHIAQQHILV